MTERGVLKRLIVLEGIDGAGTSSQAELLAERIRGTGLPVRVDHEPTTGPVGALIADALQHRVSLEPGTLAFLYAGDRFQHLNGPDGILSWLSAGGVVIADRWYFSSLAYQGVTAGSELATRLNASFPAPELLVFIDTPLAESQRRLTGRGASELFDPQDLQAAVRERYREVIAEASAPGTTVIQDPGIGSAEEVAERIWKEVSGMPILGG